MKFFSFALLIIGLIVLIQVSLPVLGFKIWEMAVSEESLSLASPQIGTAQVLGISINGGNSYFTSSLTRGTKAPYDKFNLTVPSIKIDDQEVLIDSNDLTNGLAHLPGTALPGEKGNVFISGHSTLPLIFNNSTKTVFSNLPKIKKGEKIEVTIGGSKFVYLVENIKIVDLKDVSVILPLDPLGRYITLMTCVPPGLNTKRLVVLGKLI